MERAKNNSEIGTPGNRSARTIFNELAAPIQWLASWRQQQQDIAVQGALQRLGRKPGWSQAQIQLIQADKDRVRSIASQSVNPWRAGLIYYTAVAEAWLGLVTDSQSTQDFYTILPVISEGMYFHCFQGATSETFRPASAAAHEFQKDLASLDSNFRKRAAKQALTDAMAVGTPASAQVFGSDRAPKADEVSPARPATAANADPPARGEPSSVHAPDKGNVGLLQGTDGKLKRAVTLDVASRFGGVSRRAIEKAAKKGSLKSAGEGPNRRIIVKSLMEYFPSEDTAN
jgi:hypothetical protein